MTEPDTYLVEVRLALDSAADWRLVRTILEAATDRARAAGIPIRLLESTALPVRTAVLARFAAPSEEALRTLLEAAALPVQRVERAVSLEVP